MQKLILLAISMVALFLFACNESTVNPIPESQNNSLDYITKYVWKWENPPVGGSINPTKIKFEKDSTFTAQIDGVWRPGKWSLIVRTLDITKKDSSILLDYDWNMPSLISNYQLVSINSGRMIVNQLGTTNNYEYTPEVIFTNEVTVSGDITFDVTMTNPADKDLTNAKVCIVWVNPQDDESSVIYGIGEIDKQNLTYNIKVNDSFPMSLFMFGSPKITGYFNVGNVAIMWGEDVFNGKVIKRKDITERKIGMLSNRAFVFVSGDYKKWNIDPTLLNGDIKQGFNFCEGWYANQQGINDGWKPTPLLQKQYIKVVPKMLDDSFVFPNWN